MARRTRRAVARRRLITLAAVAAASLVAAPLAGLASVSPPAPAHTSPQTGAEHPSGNRDIVTVTSSSGPERPTTRLQRLTGLDLTIDSVSPTTLRPGEDLRIKGAIRNSGEHGFANAKVYLDISPDPANTRRSLAEFATPTGAFGNRVVEIGYFDELGRLQPGSTTNYSLRIPFGKLPISRNPGIYHVGVTVIAGQAERAPVARADTLVPLLPEDPGTSEPTDVVTLIPMAAPIRRTAAGVFLDDDLAGMIAYGGQLRNLLDFVQKAPPHTMEVVLDPALRAAVADMSDGYRVRTVTEATSGEAGHPGQGEAVAKQWLSDLDDTLRRQDLLFMAWDSPDASALGTAGMPGVVAAAVHASQRYASNRRITTTVASWPYAGAVTRRGIAVAATAGAPLRIVSQRSLVNLRGQQSSAYPPTQVVVPTVLGPTTALVTRTDIAGDVITSDLSGEQLLQDIVAEATVRSLDKEPAATTVVAVPFGWDPGNAIGEKDLEQAYDFPTVRATTAATAVQDAAVPYKGPIRMPRIVAGLSQSLLDSVAKVRKKGSVYAELLSDQGRALAQFDQTLAASATSLWRNDTVTRTTVNTSAALQAGRKAAQVSVTGPTFLALSSGSGRFPLTVTNALPDAVNVRVLVRADNPAVKVDEIDPLTLAPGQHRDIEALVRTNGSGLTTVRIQLTTANARPVGQPWSFDIRATQIGVAIWIVMGIGAAILFGAAARRTYVRIRSGDLQTREEPNP